MQILKSLRAGLYRLSSGSGHVAGLVVCLCSNCSRQQAAAAPGILPAVFWELAQILSLLLLPSFVNGAVVAVRYWEGHEDLPSSLLFDIALLQFCFSWIKTGPPCRQLSYSPTEGLSELRTVWHSCRMLEHLEKKDVGRWRLKLLQSLC